MEPLETSYPARKAKIPPVTQDSSGSTTRSRVCANRVPPRRSSRKVRMCAPKGTLKSAHKSTIYNSQQLKTTQVPVKSSRGKKIEAVHRMEY